MSNTKLDKSLDNIDLSLFDFAGYDESASERTGYSDYSYWQSTFPMVDGIIPFLKWFIYSIWSFFENFWNAYALIVMPISLIGIWELIRSNRSHILYYWGNIFLLLLIFSFFVWPVLLAILCK